MISLGLVRMATANRKEVNPLELISGGFFIFKEGYPMLCALTVNSRTDLVHHLPNWLSEQTRHAVRGRPHSVIIPPSRESRGEVASECNASLADFAYDFVADTEAFDEFERQVKLLNQSSKSHLYALQRRTITKRTTGDQYQIVELIVQLR